jgi:hypothetical protein
MAQNGLFQPLDWLIRNNNLPAVILPDPFSSQAATQTTSKVAKRRPNEQLQLRAFRHLRPLRPDIVLGMFNGREDSATTTNEEIDIHSHLPWK